MTAVVRFARFNVVGALGIGVQLATVAVLVHALGANPVAATAAGVTAAVMGVFLSGPLDGAVRCWFASLGPAAELLV